VGKIDKNALRAGRDRARLCKPALRSLSLLEGANTDVAVRESEGGRLMSCQSAHSGRRHFVKDEYVARAARAVRARLSGAS